MNPGESGKLKGDEYAELFEKWLRLQSHLPGHGGKPNKTEIARLARIGDRKRFYDNPTCIALLANCKLPVVNSDGTDTDKSHKENNAQTLDSQLARAEDEKYKLERKLLKLEHIEQIIESGRRFVP